MVGKVKKRKLRKEYFKENITTIGRINAHH